MLPQKNGSFGGALRDLQKMAARETTHRKDCIFFLIYLFIHVPWDSWLNNELHFSCHKNVWPQQSGNQNISQGVLLS